MNQPPQSGKSLISKAEYMRRQGKRLKLCLQCLAVLLFPLLFVLNAISHHSLPIWQILCSVICGLLFVPASIFAARQVFKEAKQIVPGVPLTRTNAADLSAPESLVRASEAPVQKQETVLLRAASEAQERHKEQLVRAAAGGTE